MSVIAGLPLDLPHVPFWVPAIAGAAALIVVADWLLRRAAAVGMEYGFLEVRRAGFRHFRHEVQCHLARVVERAADLYRLHSLRADPAAVAEFIAYMESKRHNKWTPPKTFKGKLRPGFDLTSTSKLLEQLEGPFARP